MFLMPGARAGLPRGFRRVHAQQFTTAGSTIYSPSRGLIMAFVRIVGGGGAGGSITGPGANQAEGSAGGGGGGYAERWLTPSQMGPRISITIGAAGVPGAAGTNPGGNGGNSAFGQLLVAFGGTGGGAGGTSVGGAAGGGSTGDVTLVGFPGGSGTFNHATGVLAISGVGGNSHFGAGGVSPIGNGAAQAGNAGTGFGSGGSGACAQGVATTAQGGAGTTGACYVYEFCLF